MRRICYAALFTIKTSILSPDRLGDSKRQEFFVFLTIAIVHVLQLQSLKGQVKKEETHMVHMLTKDNYEQEVMKSEGTVLVDFYADWCGPCKMQGPIVEQLAEERTDVKFCKLNVDDAVAIAMELGISSIPTIMVVKNGEITYKQPGLMQKAQLEALL